jgi:hypothetical protein
MCPATDVVLLQRLTRSCPGIAEFTWSEFLLSTRFLGFPCWLHVKHWVVALAICANSELALRQFRDPSLPNREELSWGSNGASDGGSHPGSCEHRRWRDLLHSTTAAWSCMRVWPEESKDWEYMEMKKKIQLPAAPSACTSGSARDWDTYAWSATPLQLSQLLPCDDGSPPLRWLCLWCGMGIFVAAATGREGTTWKQSEDGAPGLHCPPWREARKRSRGGNATLE